MDENTKADAISRSGRTLAQGLLIDVAVAVAAVLLLWLPEADISSRAAWLVLGTSVVKSVLTAVASFVMRLQVNPDA